MDVGDFNFFDQRLSRTVSSSPKLEGWLCDERIVLSVSTLVVDEDDVTSIVKDAFLSSLHEGFIIPIYQHFEPDQDAAVHLFDFGNQLGVVEEFNRLLLLRPLLVF